MFFRRKIKTPKKGVLTKLEKSILNYLILKLPEDKSRILIEQLKFLVLIRRIKYKNDIVTELFPEKYGKIPKICLFNRKEEFRLAHIKFKSENVSYISEIHMVSGRIFDMKIRPKPSKSIKNITFLDIKIDEELDKDI